MADDPAPPLPEDLLVQGVVDYALFVLDPAGRVASWNAGAERIKGYRAEEILGQHFSIFYPPEDIAAGKPAWELHQAITDGRLEDEGWRLRKDGTPFWANVVITALHDEHGQLRGFGKVTRDMTERRMTEQAVVEGRRLLSHLVEAQELERRRIAWDVHDDSIQAMVAVGMRLQLLAERVAPEHRPLVHQLDEAVRGTVGRLRNLIVRLRPTSIEQHGLVHALSGYLDEVVAGWGLAGSLRVDLVHEPPTETAITIFRICQEALINVHKHAEATGVTVTLATSDNGTLVEVADDGVGIRQDPPPRGQRHFGLLEMRERAETAAGWFTLAADPDGGTTVRFWLPNTPERA
jgi:PAS domain S-box-containing protein